MGGGNDRCRGAESVTVRPIHEVFEEARRLSSEFREEMRASGNERPRGGGTIAAVCCGISLGAGSVFSGGGSGGGSVFSGGGGGAVSLAAGGALASRLASFTSVSPRSSEAIRPGGGALNSGFGGTGCGGGGGGSKTNCTAICSTSGGPSIGHSRSNNSGSRCRASEPIGPYHRARSRSVRGAKRSGGSSREGCGDTRRGAPVSVGSRRSSSGSRRPYTAAGHPAARASHPASSSNLTPRAAAFVAFEPGSAPATT